MKLGEELVKSKIFWEYIKPAIDIHVNKNNGCIGEKISEKRILKLKSEISLQLKNTIYMELRVNKNELQEFIVSTRMSEFKNMVFPASNLFVDYKDGDDFIGIHYCSELGSGYDFYKESTRIWIYHCKINSNDYVSLCDIVSVSITEEGLPRFRVDCFTKCKNSYCGNGISCESSAKKSCYCDNSKIAYKGLMILLCTLKKLNQRNVIEKMTTCQDVYPKTSYVDNVVDFTSHRNYEKPDCIRITSKQVRFIFPEGHVRQSGSSKCTHFRRAHKRIYKSGREILIKETVINRGKGEVSYGKYLVS